MAFFILCSPPIQVLKKTPPQARFLLPQNSEQTVDVAVFIDIDFYVRLLLDGTT